MSTFTLPVHIVFLWAASYIIILIVLLIISGSVFYLSYKTISKKEVDVNNYELQIFANELDRHFVNLTNISKEIITNKHLAVQLAELEKQQQERQYTYFNLQDVLKQYDISQHSDAMYLYFEDDDYFLSPTTGGQSKSIFAASVSTIGEYDYNECIDLLKEVEGRGFHFISSNASNEYSNLIYIVPISYGSFPDKKEAKLFFLQNGSHLYESLKLYDYSFKNSLYIIDKGNNILLLTPEKGPKETLDYEDMLEQTTKINQEVVSFQISQLPNWKYVVASSDTDYWYDVNYVKTAITISIAVILLLGGLGSF